MLRKVLLALALLFQITAANATVSCSLPFNLQNNTVADATQVMANYNAIVTCLGTAASAGANSDITALLGLTTPIPYTAGGSSTYIGTTSTGTANAQVVATPTPNGFSLVAGKRIVFPAGFTNTGALTLNVNSQGATNVFNMTPAGPAAMTGGEVVAGNWIVADFDGTQFQLIDPSAQFGGYSTQTTLASATTTDLGTVPSHLVLINGTTTITAFGSTASTTYPNYQIQFGGILTLTNNATSLILPGNANITTAAGDVAYAKYLGSGNWRVTAYNRQNGTAVVNPTPLCGFNGLSITNNAGTPSTNIDYAAASVVMINATGNVPIYTTAVSGTLNTTNGTVTSAADGMDGEARGNNNFVTIWFISDGTNFKSLGSLSATAPTLPAGYIYKCYAGAMKTDGSANFYRTAQLGNITQYKLVSATNTVAPMVLTGDASSGTNCSTATPTWTSFTVRGTTGVGPLWVPSTATAVELIAFASGGPDLAIFAPNNFYGGTGATTTLVPFAGAQGNSTVSIVTAWMQLEGNALFACTVKASHASVGLIAWKDAVNAN